MGKRMSPLKAIREKCLDCMGGSHAGVRRCAIPQCSLYEYRFGNNPSLKGKRGDGQALRKYRFLEKNPALINGI